MFIFANYIGVLVPIAILFFKKFRTIKSITFAAVIAVLGLWFNRYLIVVPTLETPYLPIQDTRPEFMNYSATWIEWALKFCRNCCIYLILYSDNEISSNYSNVGNY